MDFLPEQFQTHLQTSTLPTLQSLLTSSHLTTLRESYLNPYLLTPLSTLLTTATSPPDLLSVLLLVTILLISLKILDYARRIIVFWVMLVLRVLFWGAVLLAAFWVYSVGWERAVQEGGRWVGILEGFLSEGFDMMSSSGSGSGSASGGVNWRG